MERYEVVAGFNTPTRRCKPGQIVTAADLYGDALSTETRISRGELRRADAPAAAGDLLLVSSGNASADATIRIRPPVPADAGDDA